MGSVKDNKDIEAKKPVTKAEKKLKDEKKVPTKASIADEKNTKAVVTRKLTKKTDVKAKSVNTSKNKNSKMDDAVKNYAVVKVGGRQSVVHSGKILKVDRINDTDVGAIIELPVLYIVANDKLQDITKAKVTAKILEHKRDPKIIVFKKKRRQNYERTYGHKQNVTYLKIERIAVQ